MEIEQMHGPFVGAGIANGCGILAPGMDGHVGEVRTRSFLSADHHPGNNLRLALREMHA